MDIRKSEKLFSRARNILVGGVNSPVRAYKSVGGTPLFISAAYGSKIVDADGNEYIDYVGSWGPLILGSAHEAVLSSLSEAMGKGTSYGASSEVEIELAEEIGGAMPSVEKIRFVNSGTEACMSAIRLARAHTGRKKILKFEGSYHGHADLFLVKAGSGVATLGLPGSAGVPEEVVRDTVTVTYNDIDGVETAFKDNVGEIAAVIVEPVAGNMGVVPPIEGFLSSLSEIIRQDGSVLIFDEVITGFRLSKGGAQEVYGIRPDLTCLGKIVGGGLPVGAYGGREDIMKLVAPEGPVYQAGTLSGNPLTMTAGLATLKNLTLDVYDTLDTRAAKLEMGLREIFKTAGVDLQLNRAGSMIGIFLTDKPVVDYSSAKSSDSSRYAGFFHGMLAQGIYLPPSNLETVFVSAAHSEEDIDKTLNGAKEALESIGSGIGSGGV